MLDLSCLREISKGQYTECREILELYDAWEYEQAFRKLVATKNQIPSALYAACLYRMYTTDIEDVPTELLIEAFEGVDRELLMYSEELKKYDELPDMIHIFRGTENPKEVRPRLSWSLKKDVAKKFARAHLFESEISKDKVFAYFSKNTDEEEIVIDVGKEFKVVY